MSIRWFYFSGDNNFIYKCRARNDDEVRYCANKIRLKSNKSLGRLHIVKERSNFYE